MKEKKTKINIHFLREMLSRYGIDCVYMQGVDIYTQEEKSALGQPRKTLYIKAK